jgi:predicted O-methyltransferase YrrM
MDSLSYILDKWDVDQNQDLPIEFPGLNRTTLAKLFAELGYRTGAEIGTARGSYAITMSINNPGVKLYCVDAWKTYDGLHDYTDPKMLAEYLAHALHRLKPYEDIEIINELSMDAVKQFDDGSLDFVYIDANHEFPYIAEDLFYWSQKVRPGGIVSGHDYLHTPRKDGTIQVREVVQAYTEAFNIRPWFVVDKCTAKRAGSFFWVKP